MSTSEHPGTQPYTGQPYAGQYTGQPYTGQPYAAQPYADPSYAGQPPAAVGYGHAPAPTTPAGYGMPPSGPIGKVRGTGVAILLCIVTFGIYSLVWTYAVHDEMKKHTGDGLGGGLGLLLAMLVGVASPFVASSEVGAMYERAGRTKPVSGATGLWYLPGILLFFIGPIVWFVKTNGALNAYWRALGAR